MTKPTTPLIDVLKAARAAVQLSVTGCAYELLPEESFKVTLDQLNAHIAWRESGECVEAACIEYAARSNQAVIDYNMKAAIKAMEGGE